MVLKVSKCEAQRYHGEDAYLTAFWSTSVKDDMLFSDGKDAGDELTEKPEKKSWKTKEMR